jgi:glycosyltransferase involved in cell wall biosynthesis
MHLDIVLPTLNRSAQLRRAVNSVMSATRIPELPFDLYIVDNNSTDDTSRVAEALIAEWGPRVHYVLERDPGKSRALNAGIAATRGTLLAFLDDDEEISPAWMQTVARAFVNPNVDFIGGPCLPVWPEQPPAWLPPQHTAAVGRVDGGPDPKVFGKTYNGVLMGGNAVMRRAVLEKVGLFRPVLGPRVNQRLLSCEDEDLYLRLLDSGAVGWYLPDLMVFHHVQPERLTKTYHRQWCFWHGVSKAMLHVRRPPRVRELGGVPRYMYGNVLRAVGKVARTAIRRGGEKAQRFDAELTAWDLAGFVYGRHFYRLPDETASHDDDSGGAAAAAVTQATWR